MILKFIGTLHSVRLHFLISVGQFGGSPGSAISFQDNPWPTSAVNQREGFPWLLAQGQGCKVNEIIELNEHLLRRRNHEKAHHITCNRSHNSRL